MKITRILKIKKYRIFADFAWQQELHDFDQFNLIFGWNGSGKTTLSNLFRHVEKRQALNAGEEAQFLIEGRTVMGSALGTEVALPPVKVFDRDFTAANVFSSQSDSIAPIFFLGEDSIEKQKKIEALKKEMTEKQTDLAGKQQVLGDCIRELDSFCTQQAKVIRELLSSTGQNPYNNYDRRTFRTKCEEILRGDPNSKLLDDAAKKELKRKKDGNPKESITQIVVGFPDTASLRSEVSSLLSKTVLSQVLEELAQDSSVANWVREGLHLHVGDKATGSCRFCGQQMPSGRLSALQGHFNDHYNRFLAEIEAKIASLEIAKRNLRPNLPVKAAIYDHLAIGYESAVQKIPTQIKKFEDYISSLIAAVKEKQSKPFEAVDLDPLLNLVEVPDIAEGQAVVAGANHIIAQHNAETQDFTSGIKAARKGLEECLVAEVVASFMVKTSAIAAEEQAKVNLEVEVRAFSAQIDEFEREVKEHRRPAEELNEELRSYLGRSELKFQVKENGYTILRGSLPATHLSEGERTAIAFLYFLKSLHDKDFDLATGIVVIDDPISSLDTNSLFCAFGFMRERTRKSGQLFVLTHNAAFFRQTKNWFNHLNGRERRNYPRGCRARFFMISNSIGDAGIRKAALTSLDKLLHNYESDYHYLFGQVHAYSQHQEGASSLEQFYGLPNVARRVLEAFLAFRFPSLAGESRFKKQLERVNFDVAKKARIERFLNTYSHNGEIGEGEQDLSILSETPQILRDLLDLIKSEDEQHFNEMQGLISTQLIQT